MFLRESLFRFKQDSDEFFSDIFSDFDTGDIFKHVDHGDIEKDFVIFDTKEHILRELDTYDQRMEKEKDEKGKISYRFEKMNFTLIKESGRSVNDANLDSGRFKAVLFESGS